MYASIEEHFLEYIICVELLKICFRSYISSMPNSTFQFFKNQFLNCSFVIFKPVFQIENSRGSWCGVKTPTNQFLSFQFNFL